MERTQNDAVRLELWVVRHGQTVDNIKNYCQGHLDGKLTEVGVAQAKILGQRLAATRFDRCYVSDLGRTRETFEAIASQWKTFDRENASVVYSSLMREKAGGVAEGGPLSVIHEAQKKSGLPARDFKPQKGESWKDVYQRASQMMRQVFFECLVQRTGQVQRCLLVTHGGWIMELLNYIRFKEARVAPSVKNSSKNCALNVIEMQMVPSQMDRPLRSAEDVEEAMFRFSVKLENDDSHLEGASFDSGHLSASKQSVNPKKPPTAGKHHFPQPKEALLSRLHPPAPAAKPVGGSGGAPKAATSAGTTSLKKK